MKQTLLAALMTATLTSAAAAGSMPYSFPNLTFPSSQDVTVGKGCLPQTGATQTCVPQG